VGNMPSNFGEGSSNSPPREHSGHSSPGQPARRTATWPAIVIATIAATVAVAALIVAVTRSSPRPAISTTPTYTTADTAAAHQKLCEVYKLAARAVQIDTNGSNPAFAGIATVNGAVMLEEVVNRTPAIAPRIRCGSRRLMMRTQRAL
jgi:hypothetical protein